MDILLHIGMPKAGSTALQSRFAALRPWLAEQGLAYPPGLHTPHNHSFLIAAAPERESLPRHYRRIYGGKRGRALRDLSGWFDAALAGARAAGARQLVLSAETLFRTERRDNVAGIVELLRRAGGRLTVVAYLRRPSEFYVSAVQQWLKAAQDIPPPEPPGYRYALRAWSELADELRVRAYDRATFPGGDIARAFHSETCAGADLPAAAPAAARANASISAEGMALLQEYRAAFHAGAGAAHRKDSNALLRAIVAAEADPDWTAGAPEAPRPAPPRLHPDLARHIDQAATDLGWLRDRFGLVFDGIDYDALARPARRWPRPERVADICPVDDATAERLKLHALKTLAAEAAALQKQARKKMKRKKGTPA